MPLISGIIHGIAGAVFGHVSKSQKVNLLFTILSSLGTLGIISILGSLFGISSLFTLQRVFFIIVGSIIGHTTQKQIMKGLKKLFGIKNKKRRRRKR